MVTGKKVALLFLIPLSIALVTIGFIVYAVLSSCNGPVAKTNAGTYRGLHASDGEYDMYLGIPYARVNSSNVFGPAIPQLKMDDIFDADDDTAICPQYDEFNKILAGTLDCLRLNVYTPKSVKTKNRHAVLVFIHGGDYKAGFGRTYLFGPKYLIRHGIILVTMNYRLGPYGFLCSNIPQVSNQGFKDQIIALKWIQNNIAHFGGDNRRVTIAGVGSGGESVNLHLMHNKENLFQNVIIESGIFLKDKDDEDTSSIIELAVELNFEAADETEALYFLNDQNVKSVIAASVKLHLDYGPCIENEHADANAFVTRKANNTNIERVPILIGHSDKEMLRDYAHRNLDRLEWRNLFSDELQRHFDFNEDRQRKMEKYVRRFYIGDEKVGEKIKNSIIDFSSDIHSYYPTKRMIDKYLEHNPKRVYYSVFSYSGGRNFAKSIYNISMDGATNGDVLGYLFDMPYVQSPDDEDRRVMEYMSTLWVNFVKVGNPTPVPTTLIPIAWKPVNKDKLNYFEIDSTLTSKVTPFRNRTIFWDLFYKLNSIHELITKYVEPWQILSSIDTNLN